MSVKDIYFDDLPENDFSEIVFRLSDVKTVLGDVDDDCTRQELYRRMRESAAVIGDVIADIEAIEKVMRAVVSA